MKASGYKAMLGHHSGKTLQVCLCPKCIHAEIGVCFNEGCECCMKPNQFGAYHR